MRARGRYRVTARSQLRKDEAAQMYCAMLIRRRHDSRGHGPEHVDEVLKDFPRYRHTVRSLLDAVNGYINGGCGMVG